MATKIYWTSIEYKFEIKPKEINKMKGGFVYVFINAKDVKDALDNLLKELNLIGLIPIEIEFIKPYEKELEWETVEDTNHYMDLFKEAKKTKNAIFDTFYNYEKIK